MHRRLRIALRVFGVLFAIGGTLWIILASYISLHKQELLQKITRELSKSIGGTLTVEDMKPSLIFTFPYISVSLHSVSIHDSLWSHHHHDLLKADRIYLQLNSLSLFRNIPVIHEITVKNGSIFLFTDSLGYTNTYLLHRQDTTTIKTKKQAVFNRLSLHNMKVIIDDRVKHKLFDFEVHRLAGKIDYSNNGWVLWTDISTRIAECNFNTARGSFLKNKLVTGKLKLEFQYASHILDIPRQTVYMDDDAIEATCAFSFAEKVPTYSVDFTSAHIAYRNAVSIVSPGIARHLDSFQFSDPVCLHAFLYGKMQYHDTPLVRVFWKAKDNALITPMGTLDKCSLEGFFTNGRLPEAGHNDHNSCIRLYNVSASWSDVPFKADTISLLDFHHPLLQCHVTSSFPVKNINTLTGIETFTFDAGDAQADIYYKGGVSPDDTIKPVVSGTVQITKAAMSYPPRDLYFKNCNALLTFSGNDLYIKNVHLQTGQSILVMDGTVKNLLNFYYNDPDKIEFDWNITSPMINLNEFRSFFIRKKRAKSASARYKKLNRVAHQLDEMLNQSNVFMNLHVDNMVYRQFAANNINAGLRMNDDGINVEYVNLLHAGGTISGKANLMQQGRTKRFTIQALIGKVKIDRLFRAFDNFGQDAIDYTNITGRLSANVAISGQLTENTRLVPKSIEGKVQFELQEGMLKHFEPIEKVGKFGFRNRNLSNITLSDVKSEFNITTHGIQLSPLIIRSSAINFRIEGIYAPPSSTDISLIVPLGNPDKTDVSAEDIKMERNWKRGLVLYLKATDGDSGKLKIGWDRSNGFIKKEKTAKQEKRAERRKRRREKAAKE